jgi:hypothetical protein
MHNNTAMAKKSYEFRWLQNQGWEAKRIVGKAVSWVMCALRLDFKGELRHRVQHDPIQGPDIIELEGPILASVAVESLYEDYVRLSTPGVGGGLLVVLDRFGSGKSFAAHAVARATTGIGPERYLVLTPRSTDSGDTWAADVKSLAGASGSLGSTKFVDVLVDVMTDSEIQTGPDSGLTIKDFKPKYSQAKRSLELNDRRGVVVMEDCNPTSLAVDDTDASSGNLHADSLLMGEAYGLLSAVAISFYGECIIAIVTTKYPRVARALHFLINGGSKCKIASSLTTVGNGYNPDTFDFGTHFRGFLWSTENRLDLFKQKFPFLKDAGAIRRCAENTELSIRSACDQLTELMKEQNADNQSMLSTLPAPSSSETTDIRQPTESHSDEERDAETSPGLALVSDLTLGCF